MNALPEDAIIGLITFGTNCFIHELSENPKQYAFRGTREISAQMIIQQLGLRSKNDFRGAMGESRRFLCPVAECEYIIGQIIEELDPDPWIVPSDSRPLRCVGTAISAGLSLLEVAYPGTGARLMLVLGGAATIGPGIVVSEKLTDQIRTHLDIKNNKNKYSKEAQKFYETQVQRAVKFGHCIDIFCCSLDQSGLMEMKCLIEKTGGYFVVHDTFEKQVFKDSILRVFQRDTTGSFKMAFNGRIEIFLNNDVKVCGCIGPCLSEKKKSKMVSETEIGEGQTVM